MDSLGRRDFSAQVLNLCSELVNNLMNLIMIDLFPRIVEHLHMHFVFLLKHEMSLPHLLQSMRELLTATQVYKSVAVLLSGLRRVHNDVRRLTRSESHVEGNPLSRPQSRCYLVGLVA
jgi:hypothetical protein